jgi:hypothetical protein
VIFAILVIAVLMSLALLPQLWVQRVIKRHAGERSDYPGTGGEFARHILDEMGLKSVKVEQTDSGDHYDPEAKAVRLSAANMGGRSLSAVVIAAHEVGHAMQDATGYAPLKARTRIAKQAQRIETFAAIVMLAAPLLFLVAKAPHVIILQVMVGVLLFAATVLMHVVTLPTEFDASFNRALPVLEAGRYISPRDMTAARQILRAAALTYVAAAAMSMLDIARWFRVLRF